MYQGRGACGGVVSIASAVVPSSLLIYARCAVVYIYPFMRRRPIGCFSASNNEVKVINTKEKGVETSFPKVKGMCALLISVREVMHQ